MSAENEGIGRDLYATGGAEIREWLERQWSIWPKRADESRTTNISLHYGGVLAFREIHGCQPLLSSDFASHVAWFDKQEPRP